MKSNTSAMIALVLAVLGTTAAQADYLSERAAAVKLLKAEKVDEAFAAFSQLAEAAVGDVQKSDALEQAALCADRLQKFDRAWELAREIPKPAHSKNCQMTLLLNHRKWDELIATYKDEDFSKWPESIRGQGYLSRGHAYYYLKNGSPAVQDLSLAVEFITDHNTRGYCLNLVGDAYHDFLKDDEKALAAYRRTYQTGTIYKHCHAAIQIAEILKGQKKYAAALEEFGRLQLDDATAPVWRGKVLLAWGEALFTAGKPAEALLKYDAVMHIEDLPADIKQRCELAIQKAKADSK